MRTFTPAASVQHVSVHACVCVCVCVRLCVCVCEGSSSEERAYIPRQAYNGRLMIWQTVRSDLGNILQHLFCQQGYAFYNHL